MHYIYIYISHATKSERSTHEHNETEDNNQLWIIEDAQRRRRISRNIGISLKEEGRFVQRRKRKRVKFEWKKSNEFNKSSE